MCLWVWDLQALWSDSDGQELANAEREAKERQRTEAADDRVQRLEAEVGFWRSQVTSPPGWEEHHSLIDVTTIFLVLQPLQGGVHSPHFWSWVLCKSGSQDCLLPFSHAFSCVMRVPVH